MMLLTIPGIGIQSPALSDKGSVSAIASGVALLASHIGTVPFEMPDLHAGRVKIGLLLDTQCVVNLVHDAGGAEEVVAPLREGSPILANSWTYFEQALAGYGIKYDFKFTGYAGNLKVIQLTVEKA